MASQQPDPPSDELLEKVPVPVLPAISKGWLLIKEPWVLTLLIFHIIAAELLFRSGYHGDHSVILQTRSTRAFVRCWLSLYGWINKKQLVEFIDQHMMMFQKKGFIKFEFWNGLKPEVYWASFTEISCLKKFTDAIFGMIIDTYWVNFIVMGKQNGLITQDISLIWKKSRSEKRKNLKNLSKD